MTQFVKNSRLRKVVSTMCAVAMLLSLIVVPAFAATPSTGTLTSAGDTGIKTVSGSASNGLNGVHTVEIKGTIASKTKVTGSKSAAAVAAGKLGDINGFQTDTLKNFTVKYGNEPTVTIAGLAATSTVSDVVAAIGSQVASVTTGYVPVWGYAFVEAKQVGTVDIKLADNADGTVNSNGVIAAVFGTPGKVLGSAYAASVVDTFVAEVGTTYTVSAAKLGYVDGAGTFKETVDPVSQLYTAVKLGAGYDLVLATDKTNGFDAVGLGLGKAVVSVAAGVRDVAAPASFKVTPAKQLIAATPETMTIELAGPASGDSTAAMNAANFSLPAGWSIPSTASVSAKVGADATATAKIVGNVIEVRDFVLGVSETLTVVAERVTPDTKAGDYNFAASYRNIGTTVFTPVEVPALPTKSGATVTVAPVNKVNSIVFTASGNRAGAVSVLSARLYDVHNNEIGPNGFWSKTVTFSNITSPVVDPASKIQAGLDSDSSWDVNYGYSSKVDLSSKAGVTTLQAVVAGEQTATVSVDTNGVGEPFKLVIKSDKNPQEPGVAARFHVGLVDASGKETSYLTGSHTFQYRYGAGGQKAADVTIDPLYSETVFTAGGGVDDGSVWDMWVVDNRYGALQQSATLTQLWNAKPAVPGVYTNLRVTATPVVPVRSIDGVEEYNDGQYGYAAVGNEIALKVQAVDGDNMAVRPDKTVTVNVEDLDLSVPGTISSKTATLSADGSYTFVVKSTFPTGFDMWGNPVFNDWKFTDAADSNISALGHTLFFAPTVKSVETGSNLVLASGTDTTTVTATVVDLFGKPVPGATVMFSTSLGTLSAPSAVTNNDGKASVSIKSSDTGVAKVMAVVGTGNSQTTDLTFTDYQAVLLNTPTLQQSNNGNYGVHLKFQIKSLDGTTVAFTKDAASGDAYEYYGALQDVSSVTYDNGVVDMVVDVDTYELAAGSKASIGFDAYIDVKGTLGLTEYYYSGDFKLPVVNNAVLTAKGSTLLGQFGLVGSGFAKGGREYVDDWDNVRYMPEEVFIKVGDVLYSAGSVEIDKDGKINSKCELPAFVTAGTYDLVVDGITFPGALVVGNDLAIGAYPLLSMLTANSGTNYVTAGTNVTFSGAVMSYDADTVSWTAIKVNLYRSASADGSNGTLVASGIIDQYGRFSFAAPVSSTGYYYVLTDANSSYGASDSRITGITKVSVKTKTTMKVTSAPKTTGVNHSFTSKGSIAGGHGKATTVAFKIYRSNGSLYKTYSVSIAAGQKSFSKTGMKIGSKGTFYVKAFHSDYNHLASTSAGWKIVVK